MGSLYFDSLMAKQLYFVLREKDMEWAEMHDYHPMSKGDVGEDFRSNPTKVGHRTKQLLIYSFVS